MYSLPLNNQVKKPSGFTLVELSIVLVIIGLIVGGVLVGNDLIEAAKLRKVASDYEKYNTAVMTFKLKYNCLPGDCPNATTFGFASNGDGDKQIDYPRVGNSDTPSEPYYLWQHIGQAGLIDGSYTGTVAFTCASNNACNVPTSNVPSSPLGASKFYLFFFRDNVGTSIVSDIYKHYFILGNSQGDYNGIWHNETLTPLQMKSADDKYDDGMPYTGRIVHTATTIVSAGCATSSSLSPTATYQISNNDDQCLLMWKAKF